MSEIPPRPELPPGGGAGCGQTAVGCSLFGVGCAALVLVGLVGGCCGFGALLFPDLELVVHLEERAP